MQYRSALFRIFAGGIIVILSAIPGKPSVLPSKDRPAATQDFSEHDLLALAHHYCLALAVYFEGGSTGESELGQRHIARVVIGRAKANKPKWGGGDLCDVVFYKRGRVCQFSFACLPPARRTPKGGPAWEHSLAIARDELMGRTNVKVRSIRYYMNAALTPARNACRFRKEFMPVVQAGRHEFFREPTTQELVRLARSKPAECVRHARAKKSKKRIAKTRGKGSRHAVTGRKKVKKTRHARR